MENSCSHLEAKMSFVQGNNIGEIVGIFSLLPESFSKLFESIQHFFGDVYAFFLIPISMDNFPLPLPLCMMLIWIHVSGEGKEEEKEERVLTCGGRETTNKRLLISPKNEHSWNVIQKQDLFRDFKQSRLV